MNPSSFLILLAMAFYGLLHSILASLGAKSMAERWFGARVQRWYRLFFNAAAVITFVPILLLTGLLPDRIIYTIPMPWALLSGAVQLIGVIGLTVGVLQTGASNFLGIEQLLLAEKASQPRTLQLGGLYRWVRHPLYFCSLLFIWSTPLMTWNVLMFNLGVSAYLTIGTLFEERKLRREFGQAYVDYQKRVPMLIPGLKPRND